MLKESIEIWYNSAPIRALIFVSVFLIIFGIKLSLIGNYGEQTPYMDQWDGEAANLYIPYFEKHFEIKSLLAPHNEHRILSARIVSFILLTINGIWNPVLQMTVNAAIASGTICLLIAIMAKIIGRRYLLVLILFALGLFCIPFGWENMLSGFQSEFYLTVLMGTVALDLVVREGKLNLRCIIGILAAVFAFFSLASGAFILFAAAITIGVKNNKGDKFKKNLVLFIILISLFLLEIFLTPRVAHHDSLKAHSISEFLISFNSVIGWPVAEIIPQRYFWLAGVIQAFPSLFFLYWMLSKRQDKTPSYWVLFALVIWIMVSEVSISYGRAVSPIASRYTDIYGFGIILSFSCMVLFFGKLKKNNFLAIMVFVWIFVTFIALLQVAHHTFSTDLPTQKKSRVAAGMNVRDYVITGDNAFLLKSDIPYPNRQRLADLLNNPSLRRILPPNISGTGKSGRFDFLVNLMISRALSFVVVGFCGLILVYLLAAQDKTFPQSSDFTRDVS
jgi:hypothetical protein